MHQIKADKMRNVMYILLRGFLNESEVKETVSQIKMAADELKPGFVVINDISEFFPTSRKVEDEIVKVQTYVSQKGCRRTIRVIGNVLSKHQVKRCHEAVPSGYEVVEVNTLDEAERYLNRWGFGKSKNLDSRLTRYT